MGIELRAFYVLGKCHSNWAMPQPCLFQLFMNTSLHLSTHYQCACAHACATVCVCGQRIAFGCELSPFYLVGSEVTRTELRWQARQQVALPTEPSHRLHLFIFKHGVVTHCTRFPQELAHFPLIRINKERCSLTVWSARVSLQIIPRFGIAGAAVRLL